MNRIITEWNKIFFTVCISQAHLRPQLPKLSAAVTKRPAEDPSVNYSLASEPQTNGIKKSPQAVNISYALQHVTSHHQTIK